jgi:hypothetical protein
LLNHTRFKDKKIFQTVTILQFATLIAHSYVITIVRYAKQTRMPERRKSMRKILSTWGIIILMLSLVVGTAAAQSGSNPSDTPTAVPTSQPAGSTLYLHPIVQILSSYFGRETRPMLPTPTPTLTPTVDPSATATEVSSETSAVTPTATPMGPEDFAKQIEMYHDEGIGFGVLVKIYAMAEASVQACLDQPTPAVPDPNQVPCEPVTVEQLVGEFQGGTGMGQLFKEYGKPALLGVGHVRKDLKNQPAEMQTTPTPPPTNLDGNQTQDQNQNFNNGNGNGNGKGNGNGNGNGNSNKPPKAKAPKTHGPKK